VPGGVWLRKSRVFRSAFLAIMLLLAVVIARVIQIELSRRADSLKEILNYKLAGAGQPSLVLLHGLFASNRYWSGLVPALATNHRVLAIDLLGFGESPKPNIAYTTDEHISAIDRTMRQGSVGPKVILIGHSMGATLALDYALKYPAQLDGLVLINLPVVRSKGELEEEIAKSTSKIMVELTFGRFWSRLFCALHELVPLMPYPFIRMAEPELPAEVALDATRHTWKSFSGSLENVLIRQDGLGLVASIKNKPILIILSREDSHSKRADFGSLQKQKNVKIVLLEGDHNFLLKDHDQVVAFIKAFAAANNN
jgi:pimeloyl-ACP methyl ester carboxylesterase